MNWREASPLEFSSRYIGASIFNLPLPELEKLATDPEFFENLETLRESKSAYYNDKGRITYTINSLKTFGYVMKIYDVLVNPKNYSSEERTKLFETVRNQRIQMIHAIRYGELFKNTIEFFFGNYKIFKKNQMITREEQNAVEKIGKILEFNRKNDNKEALFYYIFIDLEIPLSHLENMRKNLVSAYLKSVAFGTEPKAYEKFSINDLPEFDDILKQYDVFIKKIHPHIPRDLSKSEEETISKLLDLIYQLYEKYGNNCYKVIYILAHDYNITCGIMDEKYMQLCKQYSVNYSKMHIFSKKLDFLKIYLFMFIIDKYYNDMLRGQDYLREYIEKNINDEQKMSELYFILSFNNVMPQMSINGGGLYLSFKGISEFERIFTHGYYKCYEKCQNEKREQKLQKNSQKQDQKYSENLPKYEQIIRSYIEAGSTIEEYCEKNKISPSKFREIVDALKEHNHSLFQEYDNYTKKIIRQNFAINRKSLDQMVSHLMSNAQYTLLDYYNDTRMHFDTVKNFLSNDPSNIQNAFKKFCQKYSKDFYLSLEQALKIDKEYAIRDSEGNIIKMYKISPEEKQQVIIMLKEQKIPITNATFLEQLKRYFQNEIKPQYTSGQK